MIKIIIKSFLILLLLSIFLKAQQQEVVDTTLSSNEITFEMQKSPWGAVGRSVLLPGWGQFYNEDYWHVPVIWGFLGWFGYQWVLNNNDYKTSRDLFIETGNEIYRRQRDFYRDQRDNFTIYITITYLLNLVDAFVGAHLFDFSVEEDYVTKTPMLKVKYHF
ncbi:MAG: hypothetical protein IIB08_01260 [Bacteroidetes bacterium]|nr:hypothetical protein [Bacteroidota bacterium]